MVALRSFFSRKSVLLTVWMFASVAPWLFYICRTGHVFIDIVLFKGFSSALFALMIASAISATVLAFLRIRSSRLKDARLLPSPFLGWSVASFVLTFVFTVVWIASLATMGKESSPVALRMLLPTLPIGAAVIAAVFFALFFPALSSPKLRTAIAVVTIAALLFGTIGTLYPLSKFRFLADPMVLDTGKGYSIVFATNTSGTGFVRYDYGGKTYTLYDTDNGRKENALIHSVFVPYEHLDGNAYTVGATRVIDELSYGGTNGKTIVSDIYRFSERNRNDQTTYLSVSDWHTFNDLALRTASLRTEYDGILLLGDALPGLQFEEEAAEYIVKFGGDLSGGTIPVVYVRGNHETRGAYATELSGALGLEKFYYTVETDACRFVVLDSAEDKNDDHPEYGGMTDYTAHRTQMVEWLEGLTPSEKPTVILSHAPEICIENDLRARAFAAIESLNATLMVSGHYHVAEIRKENDLDILLDGGHSGKSFVASALTLTRTGIGIEAWNDKGTTVLTHTIDYRTPAADR